MAASDPPKTPQENFAAFAAAVDRLKAAIWEERWDFAHFVGVVWVAVLVVALALGWFAG